MTEKKTEKQLTWTKVNSKKLELENGHNIIVSTEDLSNDENQNITRFIIIKKWKTDEDGVSFKKPTKMYIQEKFWNDVKKGIDSLNLPN